MIRNYFTIALRSLRKNPVFTIINVLGLSLGMTAFILIFQYITFEKSVNKFHTNLPSLYRILLESPSQGKAATFEFVSPAIGPLFKDQFEEVSDYCRGFQQGGIISYGEPGKNEIAKVFREDDALYVDGSFFTLFSFPVVHGNPVGLAQPNTVAISESYAKKYFGNEGAIDKILTLDNQFGTTLFKVIAVFKDMPDNSDIKSNLLFSLQTLANPSNLNGNQWASLDNFDGQFLQSYVIIKQGTDYKNLENKMTEAKKKVRPASTDIVRLQPMRNVHLPESLSDYYTTSGNLKFLYVLEGIAVLILVIAWFNYINLSTAGALKRAKEVGIRKVVGASRKQLMRQFLGESILLNLIGLLVALSLVNLLQVLYNQLVHKELSLGVFRQNWQWLGGFTLILIGAFASGGYSAFALSAFNPAQTLKGVFSKSVKGILMRKTLVVFQFSISILLIASTLILYRQLNYMQNENLGINLEQLVTMTEPVIGQDSTFKKRSKVFLNDLASQSFIKDYSMSGTVPGNWYNYSTPGYISLNPNPEDEKIVYSITYIDDHYLPIFGIGISAGKNFTQEICSKSFSENDKIMINESASHLLGFESPELAIGQKITTEEKTRQFEIMGVVKDYHHLSLRQSIDPILFFPMYNPHYFTVKISTDQIQSNMEDLEALYKKNFPGNPFEFFFVDKKYNQQYQTEQQYGAIFSIASGLAIFIACLGLFGLSTFMVEQRLKEVGIRKVLGANSAQITRLLSKDFLMLVFIAIIIATPLSWYAMDKWLQDFAYRTEITWWIFGIAGTVALLIAVVTVSSQALKAAMSNPVESLRSE